MMTGKDADGKSTGGSQRGRIQIDEPNSTLSGRTGRPPYKTHQPADAVIGFLEEKLSEPVAAKVGDFVEGKGDDIGDAIGEGADRFKGLLGG